MKKKPFKKYLITLSFLVVFFVAVTAGAVADRLFGLKPLDVFFPKTISTKTETFYERELIKEESVVIDVVERASPSVVTVSVKTPARSVLEFSPFGGLRSRTEQEIQRDIGTGFVVSSDGLIITNRHVVSRDADYIIVSHEGKEYEVEKISRDPSNDIAILKVNATDLEPIEMGDSSNLKVGQFVIAIGTALGEFRHTVTTGVISGLGRGITAGSIYEGYVERLDDVIQTDAAINPGNSGGPLIDSSGRVIGVNVAVAGGAENIGFAIPIDVVKQGLAQFELTGKFVSRPFLGVQYQMISERSAILNGVPEGAYVITVVENSPAEVSGVMPDDIIVKIDGKNLKDDEDKNLASAISSKKPGDKIDLEVWRGGETLNLSATLSEFSE